MQNYSLNRPCFICFVASESTDNTSTKMFVIMPIIEGEKVISARIRKRLRKVPMHSNKSTKAS